MDSSYRLKHCQLSIWPLPYAARSKFHESIPVSFFVGNFRIRLLERSTEGIREPTNVMFCIHVFRMISNTSLGEAPSTRCRTPGNRHFSPIRIRSLVGAISCATTGVHLPTVRESSRPHFFPHMNDPGGSVRDLFANEPRENDRPLMLHIA